MNRMEISDKPNITSIIFDWIYGRPRDTSDSRGLSVSLSSREALQAIRGGVAQIKIRVPIHGWRSDSTNKHIYSLLAATMIKVMQM